MTPPKLRTSALMASRGMDMLSANVTLQPFSNDDASEILDALQDRSLARWLVALPVPVDPNSGKKYVQFLQDPEVHARILRIDRNFAGLVSLGSELTFWIRSELHRNGLGTWAVREFLDQLPSDIAKVTACCMQENKPAAKFLTKLGFLQVGSTFQRFSFVHVHAVPFLRFELTLSPATSQEL